MFQNRYKSIVCEEEPYLLELVRYIHLNPLRAGLVHDTDALGRYPWCGHGVLLGESSLRGQVTEEILLRFSNCLPIARQLYRQFVVDGVAQGQRDELVGGGLRRSSQLAELGMKRARAFLISECWAVEILSTRFCKEQNRCLRSPIYPLWNCSSEWPTYSIYLRSFCGQRLFCRRRTGPCFEPT